MIENFPIHEFLELYRVIQKKNRFISTATDNPLSLTESHLMVEIDGRPRITAGELVTLIGLDKSNISRCLANLKRRRLIHTLPLGNDRRVSNIELTELGKSTLEKFDQSANENMRRFSSDLSIKQQFTLATYIEKTCDCAGIMASANRTSDHPLRPQIRRITRALGLLGTSVLGSGLSSSQWHVLTEVDFARERIRATQISQILGIAPNTVSIVLRGLTTRHLVTRNFSKVDRRTMIISLTTRGQDILNTLRENGRCFFAKTLEVLDLQQLQEYLALLETFSGMGQVAIKSKPELRIVRITAKRDFSEARVFLLREIVKRGLENSAGSILLNEDNLCYALLQNENFVGIIEFQQYKNNIWYVLNGIVSQHIDPLIVNNFVQRIFQEFLEAIKPSEIIFENLFILDRKIAKDLRKEHY